MAVIFGSIFRPTGLIILRAWKQEICHAAYICVVLLCTLGITPSMAQNVASEPVAQIKEIRLWHSPDKTRIVFDLSNDVQHQVFSLSSPNRLVVDVENTRAPQSLPELNPENKHINHVRSGSPRANVLRFVFELKNELVSTNFLLSPNELYGHRLVVDLVDRIEVTPADETGKDSTHSLQVSSDQKGSLSGQNESTHAKSDNSSLSKPVVQAKESIKSKKFLVAIDAGHGGEDPGALGFRGSREKKLTLQIARRLLEQIRDDPRLDAFLVREGDYYIKLHERREIARRRNADMFISIHADAFSKRSARGFSVFALSQRGATSAMASALAVKENASDLIGGVSLADKDAVLAKVLVDLSMTNTIRESVNFGGRVLKKLSSLGRLHSKRVEQAGFAVLKSADIPSVLIETGFITNPSEEKSLRSKSYQTAIAKAVHAAISDYLDESPFVTQAVYSAATNITGRAASGGSNQVYTSLVKPPKPVTHRVIRGDSLSKIAVKYGTSVVVLKRLNKLRGSTVRIGQKLKLPKSASSTRAQKQPASRSGTNTKVLSHTVKRGETLSIISARYNITIKAIKSLNKLRGNTVYIGQKLKLPVALNGRGKQDNKPKYHTVRRGDTLSEIAQKYGVSMRVIMRMNAMKSSSVLLGQRLKIR